MYMGERALRIWVPERVIVEHCSSCAIHCQPYTLLFECYELLVQDAWRRLLVKQGWSD